MIKKLKKLTILFFLSFLLIITVSESIFKKNKKICYDDISRLPYNETGLLLGTSKYLKNGKENPFFRYRIKAAAELYKNGKIKYIIASGNNKPPDKETELMKSELIKNGIPPEKIIPDNRGYRTYDSVVRSKKVFGKDKITVISQRFHNLRAVYVARRFGINAVAYNAENVKNSYGIKIRIRELFAKIKALFDIYISEPEISLAK